MKTINLEETLKKYITTKIEEVPFCGAFHIVEEFTEVNSILKAMKEAIKQALELAAENAITVTDVFSQTYEVDKQSILDTINQIE